MLSYTRIDICVHTFQWIRAITACVDCLRSHRFSGNRICQNVVFVHIKQIKNSISLSLLCFLKKDMSKTKKKNTDDYPSVSPYLLKTKLVSDRLKEYAVTTDETNEVSENNVPEDFRSQQIDRVNESKRV